jgi:2-polyprenyl-3-methyl-5-hydroxy-6-metoxy-1,4-benzoquinol methylase
VKHGIVETLLQINYQFYQTFAASFSSTRQRLQPGVLNILETVSPDAELLDLGCGNGELARELGRCGHQGNYTGLDFSEGLLEYARAEIPAGFNARFLQINLAELDWDAGLLPAGYDRILCFAVLHHLPGNELRTGVLHKLRRLLSPGGRFIHSNWQFLNSARLRSRIQPWEEVNLSKDDVDPGDYLLDWRRDGHGLRYVHHFDEAELRSLAEETGFSVIDSTLSDGEGGKLGLYQVWEKSEG